MNRHCPLADWLRAVPIWGSPAALGFDIPERKYFADALMMDRVKAVIPPELTCMPGGSNR